MLTNEAALSFYCSDKKEISPKTPRQAMKMAVKEKYKAKRINEEIKEFCS